MPILAVRVLLQLLLALGLPSAIAPSAHAAEPLVLSLRDSQPQREIWPAVRVLADPQAVLDWSSALAKWQEFAVPDVPEGNLGFQREPVWLAIAIDVLEGDGQWVFDLEYPPFNEAKLFLVSEGQLLSEVTVGSGLAYQARPMRTRTHAAQLTLRAGQSYQLLVRLHTSSAMVLPLTLSKPAAYHEREAMRLVTQGLMFGLTAALLAYSLFNGFSLRSNLFVLYSALLLGSTAFIADFSGLGQQFLWSERRGITAMISPLSALLALAAAGPFVMQALETRRLNVWLHRGLIMLSGFAAVLFVLGLLGILEYKQLQVVATIIGPLIPMLAVPAAWKRARNGEAIGYYMLLGWGTYVAGALATASLLRGLIPANFWTLHLFQWASLLEMLAWLRVLSLHIEALRLEALRDAAAVRDLSAIALTDALTGLGNRRALDRALGEALERASAQRQMAVFMIDLDGFKAVNDRFGHEVGDLLLIEVGRRLVQELRRTDVVTRLGGDEFVVLAEGLQSESEARSMGDKLLAAFNQPVLVNGQNCPIGMTIGFALAPVDARLPADLLRMADTAMYAGKRAGRHRIQRCAAGDLAVAA